MLTVSIKTVNANRQSESRTAPPCQQQPIGVQVPGNVVSVAVAQCDRPRMTSAPPPYQRGFHAFSQSRVRTLKRSTKDVDCSNRQGTDLCEKPSALAIWKQQGAQHLIVGAVSMMLSRLLRRSTETHSPAATVQRPTSLPLPQLGIEIMTLTRNPSIGPSGLLRSAAPHHACRTADENAG